MDNTIIMQGQFEARNGDDYILTLRSDFDWIRVVNFTEATANNADHGVIYYWQRGMDNGGGLVQYHPAADQTLAIDEIVAGDGFHIFNSSETDALAEVAIAGVTNAADPVIATGDTTGMGDGTIVRLANVVGAPSLGGWDFQIDTIVAGVSFHMAYAMANTAGAAGAAGTYRIVPFDPIYYPRFRYIINITAAANAVIHTSVDHGYTVGQKVRVNLPDAEFGMTQINGMIATITAVTANTITTDIDSTAFTAFAFALPAVVPFTVPTVVPLGIDTGTALAGGLDILADATRNTAYIGVRLVNGVLSPGGTWGDVCYWVAGKSFSNTVDWI